MSKYSNPLLPKKEKTKTYSFTAETLKAEQNRCVKEGIAVGIYLANVTYSAAMLMALRDKLGFGKIRMRRVFDYVQKQFNEKVERRISDTDMLQALHDECRITLEIEKPDGVKENAMSLFREIERPATVTMRTN